jgi:hypothetical protein
MAGKSLHSPLSVLERDLAAALGVDLARFPNPYKARQQIETAALSAGFGTDCHSCHGAGTVGTGLTCSGCCGRGRVAPKLNRTLLRACRERQQSQGADERLQQLQLRIWAASVCGSITQAWDALELARYYDPKKAANLLEPDVSLEREINQPILEAFIRAQELARELSALTFEFDRTPEDQREDIDQQVQAKAEELIRFGEDVLALIRQKRNRLAELPCMADYRKVK